MSSTPLTKTETYLFYGAIVSGVLAILSFVGYLSTTTNTFLSKGTLTLTVLFALGSLGSAGVYYYERKQDVQG